jgi:hypothetical protein
MVRVIIILAALAVLAAVGSFFYEDLTTTALDEATVVPVEETVEPVVEPDADTDEN